jgi:sugar phosphate isomerase/epimerase
MIRLGGPVFLGDTTKGAGAAESHGSSADDPVLLAKAHKKKGYRAGYVPNIPIEDTVTIAKTRKAFEDEDVLLSEVGYWDNLLDTDPGVRKKNRKEMLDSFALAEEIGANCVVGLAGSFCHGGVITEHTAQSFSDEAFEEAVEMARYYIDTIKPKTAHFTYEFYQFGVVDSVESVSKLITAVDRGMFGVHLDLTNLANCPRNYWRTGALMKECIKAFGGKIVAAHAKDAVMIAPSITVKFEEVIPGRGNVDIASILRELNKLPREIPYLMEHLETEAEYDIAAEHIRGVAAREGVSL